MKKINRKLLSGIFLMMLLFLPALGTSLYSLWRVVGSHNELIGTYAESLLLTQDLRREMTQQSAAMPIFVLTGEPKILNAFETANQDFLETLAKLEILVSDPQGEKLLKEINRLQKATYEAGLPGIALKKGGASIQTVDAYIRQNAGPDTELLVSALDQFSKKTADAFEKEKESTAADSRFLIQILGFVSAITLLFFLLVGVLILKSLRQKRAYDDANELLVEKERQLSRARKETVEVVAHDLKNPISSILMSTELALERERKNPEATDEFRTSLEITMRSAQSMQRLITDLLDHSKIESGTLILSKTDCNISDFIKTMVDRFEPLAESKKLRLISEVNAPLPVAHLDEGRMEQVFSNLLGNAIKFTNQEGFVRFSVKPQDDGILFSVSDNGPGMKADQCDHIFERYWQVRETAHQGTGLGLAISRAIVQAHGGKIWVESRLGSGSQFFVFVPVGKPETLCEVPPDSARDMEFV